MPRLLSALLLTLGCIATASAQSNRADLTFEPLTTPATTRDYTARVPLTDNSAKARDAALADALAVVFERASGGAALPAFYRDRGRDWVQNFNLDRDDNGLGLRASFDPRSIDDAVVRSGLPLWGAFTGSLDTVRVAFGNVSSAERYARLMQLLSGDRRVDKLRVESQHGDQLTLQLVAEGGERTVTELMTDNGFADPRGMNTDRAFHFDLR